MQWKRYDCRQDIYALPCIPIQKAPRKSFSTHRRREKKCKAPTLVGFQQQQKQEENVLLFSGWPRSPQPFKEPWPGSSATSLSWKSHCSLSFMHILGSRSKQNRTGVFVLIPLIMLALAKSCSDKTKPSIMWILTIVICGTQYLCCLDSQTDKGGICDKVRLPCWCGEDWWRRIHARLPVKLQWLSSPHKWTPRSKKWVQMLGMKGVNIFIKATHSEWSKIITEKCMSGCAKRTHKEAMERCARWPSRLFFRSERPGEGWCKRCRQKTDTTESMASKLWNARTWNKNWPYYEEFFNLVDRSGCNFLHIRLGLKFLQGNALRIQPQTSVSKKG